MFLREGVPGDRVVTFGSILKKQLPFPIEFFPKQGQLTSRLKLGNLIKLPLGIHKKYGGRSVFFNLTTSGPDFADSLERNFELLSRVATIESEKVLSAVSASPELVVQSRDNDLGRFGSDQRRPLFQGDVKVLASRCSAIQGIRSKAESGQHLSRADAFHFANIVLSAEHGQGFVIETMLASYGSRVR